MRLKLTVSRPSNAPGGTVDVLVTVDTTVTVGELAAAIGSRDPVAPIKVTQDGVTLAVTSGNTQRPLRHDATVADAGLHSGQTVAVVKRSPQKVVEDTGETSAILTVDEGPDAGREFNLPAGASYIGRRKDNTVVLTDSMVSNQHARVVVTDVVEIVDLGSSNGVLVSDEPLPRAVVGPQDRITLGETVLRIVRRGGVAGVVAPTVEFNRAPRLDIVFAGREFEAPEAPSKPEKPRIPIATFVAPIVMAGIMYAISGQIVTIVFMALSPLMIIGSFFEQRSQAKRALREAIEAFTAAMSELDQSMSEALRDEVEGRRAEHQSIDVVVPAAVQRSTLLWTRRPDRRAFLEARLGTATLPSRNSLKLPSRGKSMPEHWDAILQLQDRYRFAPDVPAVASFREHGAVGIAGPRPSALGLARSVVTQLALLHSPAEVIVAAAISSASVADWEWLKWLPHVTSDHSPIGTETVASSPGGLIRLIGELEDLVAKRSDDTKQNVVQIPAVVLVVEDDAPVERSRVVELAELGPKVGVHVLWVAGSVSRLPAASGVFVETSPTEPQRAALGYTTSGEPAIALALETLSAESALDVARTLSPVVDAGARIDDDSDLPRAVNLLTVTDVATAHETKRVIENWAASNSLPAVPGATPKRRKRDNHLRSTIGVASGRNLVLDLRADGPHALVGGTTGSGKSEFLQSWVVSIAAEHSPSRVTFLFVDYKGGAAFADCVALPHCVGLVTDLSPHLVQRALKSLKAELRYREHILQRKRAKDLLELERRGDPDAPPSLVIVIDEFAALISEVPEFVDGVVDVAQRGRSLGLHLVLATQNPGQSIKDNLRANTNLRIALRMADPEHSMDVIGTNQAALFDSGLPGRAIVKTGANRLTPFQTGYVGGHTSDTPPPPIMNVDEWRVSERSEWEPPIIEAAEEGDSGPTDLKRLVQTIGAAYASTFTQTNERGETEVKMPRRPWQEDLYEVYEFARAQPSRTDSELRFAALDDPENQRQDWASFFPDGDGNMAIFGTGGSGKSATLRTLAIAAGLGTRGGPCHVYGLDFGTRALEMLEPLDHVGAIVHSDDTERVQRLLALLRDTIDERAGRYSAVNASSIVHYRELAKQPDEPRILVVVDGLRAFREEYETGANMRWWDLFQNIAAEGRQVGVHVIVTADAPAAIPSALNSVIQRRLVLRLSDENALVALNIPIDVFSADSPPGRGVFEGKDVQVLVLGGSANTSLQATAIKKLAIEIRAAGLPNRVAPPIGRLPERVPLSELPPEINGLPALGQSYDTLEPIGFAPGEALVVVGPPQSGRTTVMAGLVQSLVRAGSKRLIYFGSGRSLLASATPWEREATEEFAMADVARAVIDDMSVTPPDVVVIEDFPSITDYDATGALEELLIACRRAGITVLTDGDTSSVTSSALYRSLFAGRHGIVLQPDQYDGENLFKTPFPPGRLPRAEFPPGRGFYLRGGKTWRVQCALPDLGDGT